MKPGFILHVITKKQQNNDNDIFIREKKIIKVIIKDKIIENKPS